MFPKGSCVARTCMYVIDNYLFQAGPNGPLLVLSVLHGLGTNLSWSNVDRGHSYGLKLNKWDSFDDSKLGDTPTSYEDVASYYDILAENYDEAVQAWGYFMPEATTEALLRHADLEPNSEATILDLGKALYCQIQKMSVVCM